MPNLVELRYHLGGGYFPNVPAIGASQQMQQTIRAGNNCWLRGDGRIEVANGSAQQSSTNVGARFFQFNTQRATIEGALVSSRIPYAGLLRYQNAVMFYLSELTSKQVYLDESAATGVTTSATAGMLRVALPGGSWSVYDAGFEAPILASGDVTTDSSGTKSMNGTIGVALAAWRSTTNATSAPSALIFQSIAAADTKRVLVTLPAYTTNNTTAGQDGFVMGGTPWGDQSGDLSVIRYIRKTIRGTFTATNGSAAITAGSSTFFTQDVRSGDVLTINAADYTVLSVDTDTTMTLASNFGGSTASGKTATVKKACAEWRNTELGDALSYDVFKPVKAAGICSYAGRPFLWGCYGADSSAVTGPALVPLLLTNPEHTGHPKDAILTSNGDDILAVYPSETRLYMMTPNTLESVSFTADADVPYKVRVLYQPGFKAAKNGVVYQDQFYGYAEKPIRTVVDDNIDTEFGLPVWSVMKSWTPANTVVLTDPKNQAVLYCNYDGATTTTVIPWMVTLGVWGVPHTVTNQIIDGGVVNGSLYFTLLVSSNYRVYGWEAGTAGTASTPYVVSQFNDAGSPASRKVVKSLVAAGNIATLRAYRITEAGAYPDVTSTGAATASFTLSSSEKSEKERRTHINDCRGLALRVDLPTSGSLDSLIARGYQKDAVI